jgi:hypothetical protein
VSEEKVDQLRQLLQQEEAKRLETQSIERRRVIGQAIIDGILNPSEVILEAKVLNYTQVGGNGSYTQRGGGDHAQTGNGNYNQARVAAAFPASGAGALRVEAT